MENVEAKMCVNVIKFAPWIIGLFVLMALMRTRHFQMHANLMSKIVAPTQVNNY